MNLHPYQQGRILVPVLLALAVLALALGWRFWTPKAVDALLFEEVTLASGLDHRGMTFGAAWGDFDGDGLPDVYLGNHLREGTLFRNLGDGRFLDVTRERLPLEPRGADKHGALWADFDNDGDQDLVVLRGGGRGVGAEANLLYVNGGDTFEERAEAVGVANPKARTRMPLWFDANRDGRLDLFIGALKRPDGQAPAAFFVHDDAGFAERPDAAPLATDSASFCILANVDRDSSADVLCRVYEVPGQTAKIFSTAEFPLREIAPFPPTHFDDVVAADLDGDTHLDLYLARRSAPSPSDVPVVLGQRGSNELFADVWLSGKNVNDQLGFAFESAGELEVTVFDAYPRRVLSPEQVRIGGGNLHPLEKQFLLSRDVAGLQTQASPIETPTGVSIDLLDGDDDWAFRVVGDADLIANDRERHQQFTFRVVSSEPIERARTVVDHAETAPSPDRLFINREEGWSEESGERGVNEPPVEAVNVVAADFDNDMDIDLYLVVSGILANGENRLLLNRGDGTFEVVNGAGGAPGGRRGVGDSATVVDFDQDGFLDLLIANGASMDRSFGLPARGGDYRLYRNTGNENNWIAIDLEGVRSNRNGIGALVYVTAGGQRQVRLQDGGVHHRGQSHQRLHFGLASQEQADEIAVHWPSGQVQRLNDVAANQVLAIREP